MRKLAQSVLPSTHHLPTVNISNISDFLANSQNSDIDLLDLIKLCNLFHIKDPRK